MKRGRRKAKTHFFESGPLQVFALHTKFLTQFSEGKRLRICLFSINQYSVDVFHSANREESEGKGQLGGLRTFL